MIKNIYTVKQMTKGMGFDENMGKVNWLFVMTISNIGYQFMPKEKDVKFKNVRLGNVKAIFSEYKFSQNKNIIMYIHGGGFVYGSAACRDSGSADEESPVNQRISPFWE